MHTPVPVEGYSAEKETIHNIAVVALMLCCGHLPPILSRALPEDTDNITCSGQLQGVCVYVCVCMCVCVRVCVCVCMLEREGECMQTGQKHAASHLICPQFLRVLM